MVFTVSPNQTTIDAALRSFLVSILPGIEVIQGQPNRVPEPDGADFVVFTPMLKTRLSTNISIDSDARYIGSIAGTVLTITDINIGEIVVGAPVVGVGVATGTTIASFGSGTGGAGTYNLSGSAQTVSSRVLSSGTHGMEAPTQLNVQCDVHGPSSADNVQIIFLAFNDDWALDAFAEIDPSLQIAPLYASDPKQVPFSNAEKQIEFRWVVDIALEANQSIINSQQFADIVNAELISVEANYPS